ncbi:hypothetical protein CTI12_AA122030 [Artemisia annua]|uniref:Uncharacterized protein n=1 Tax=Artemisia annua TaxID=35608 RepID=A0A2U1PID4_ARTAN|nr:hypothetical protein CTI12_AA122030 [Artemisia annua]
MKKHRLQSSYRSLSASYHLLDGSVTEGSSHRRTRSAFQPPTENLQQRSGFVLEKVKREGGRTKEPYRELIVPKECPLLMLEVFLKV